ncbi:MAG: tetratricopeptide repeat protein [Fimbriimonadaceae bacterium]|nr:tetratricopeptide repeat protein [Fimbriimonadaceae bacterium]QYK58594.1 MAG: tetratricopeptide repeat protein [Fimbriimonadaceae bacterium]
MSGTFVQEAYKSGNEAYSRADYEAARASFLEVTRANPTWGDGWRMLGFSHYGLQAYAAAREAFTTAVGLDPSNGETHYGLGLAVWGEGDLEASARHFDEALLLRPDHAGAKQALVTLLIAKGKAHLQNDEAPRGEADLERAVKIDRKNPEPVTVLAKHYYVTGQKPRATKLIQGALEELAHDPQIKAMAEHLGVKADQAAVKDAAKKDAVVQSQKTQCPVCKREVMNWAAICPTCGAQLRAVVSQFASNNPVPKATWQEVAYKIIAGLWILNGSYLAFQGVQRIGKEGYMPGLEAFEVIMGAINIGVGIGLFFENEVVQFIAKLMCYLVMFRAGLSLILSLGMGFTVDAAINAAMIALAGFQLYILAQIGDV